MYFYKKDVGDGQWLLMRESSEFPIRPSQTLSIAYDRTEFKDGRVECSLLKHGSKENIEKWVAANKSKYESVGVDMPVVIDVHPSVSEDNVNFVLERSCIPEKYFDRLTHPVIEAEVVPIIQRPKI